MRDETIWDVLNRDLFFVKNAVRRREPKLCDKLDVYDPAQRVMTMQVREPGIGKLTKAARLCGGSHDRGAAFDLVASFPESDQQTVRVSGQSPIFGLNGRRVDVVDHRGIMVGSIRKMVTTIGFKFLFSEVATAEKMVLDLKPSLFGGRLDILLDGQLVATMKRNWDGSHEEYFQDGDFDYAFWISPEIKKNSGMRQALVALGLSHHRVAM